MKRRVKDDFCCEPIKPDQETLLASELGSLSKRTLLKGFLAQNSTAQQLFLRSLLSAGHCVSMFGSTQARRTAMLSSTAAVVKYPCWRHFEPQKKGSNLGRGSGAWQAAKAEDTFLRGS